VIIDRVCGYGGIYDRWSTPLNNGTQPFREIIRPGAFRMAGAAVQAMVLHEPRTVFASTTDGTMKVWADSVGLAFQADIPADLRGAGIRDWVARGDLACSIGIDVRLCDWGHDGELPTCAVRVARVHEITLTDDPAYKTACWLQTSTPRVSSPAHHRALARQWQLSQISREQATARRGIPTSGVAASARGHYVPLSKAEMRARGRFIIPDEILRVAARAAHFGRCA
jgi:HK97 family phage prohead protease